MAPRNQTIRSRRTSVRDGTAAVECAIVVPLLTLLVLGALDVGQYANVYQKVSDASRAGARIAARHSTQTTSAVESAVRNYLQEVSSGSSSSALASAAQITVTDGAGNSVPGGNLEQFPTGSQLTVRVSLQYDPVRWISGFKGLDGMDITATTVMRRE
jgi:Flp pilus assembly protein TadG